MKGCRPTTTREGSTLLPPPFSSFPATNSTTAFTTTVLVVLHLRGRHCRERENAGIARAYRPNGNARRENGGNKRGPEGGKETGNSDGVNNLRVDFPPMEGGCARIRTKEEVKKKNQNRKRNPQLEVRGSLYLGLFFFQKSVTGGCMSEPSDLFRFTTALRVWIHFWRINSEFGWK